MSLHRIAMLSPYTDPVKGGITSYTRELMAAYRRHGIECRGVAAFGKQNADFATFGGNKLSFCLQALRYLAGWSPDMVHGHSQHWYVVIPAVLWRVLRPRSRLLFTLHTPADLGRKTLIDVIIRALLRLSDGIVFVSRDMKDHFGLSDSVHQDVILSAPEALAVRRARDKRTSKRPMIVFVGPLAWSRKVAGLLLLLDAFSELTSSFPDWHLAILGDGPLRSAVETRVRELGLDDKVVVKGFVDSVFDEIDQAEIYAQISLQEGLPLSLLNAMAIGTAVLATSVGAIPEVIQHERTGYLVEPKREAVGAGLHRLMLDAGLRNTIARAAQTYVLRELSWDRVAEHHLRLAEGS